MGASNFSGAFDKNPDFFDGDGRQTRDNKTNAVPSQYDFLKEAGQRLIRRQKEAADGAAATATAEHPFFFVEGFKKSIQSVKFLPAAGITADNTNFATFIVRARKADGTLVGIVAQGLTTITGLGNFTAFVAKTIPLTNAAGTLVVAIDNANLDLGIGWMLTLEITKSGAGVVVPAGQLVVNLK
jgi:hypothetical protein